MAALSMLPDKPEAPRLGRVQRWMQACIMADGPVASAIATQPATQEFPASVAPGLIRPSRTLTPLERLDIYRRMYELRLVDALRVDYPGLLRFLGEETFDELSRLYIANCPSHSYTLNRLGDRLPEFLSQVEGLPRPRFVQALARLELTETFVFDEEESPAASAESVAMLSGQQWGRLRLVPIRALRLIRLDYPVHEYMRAVRSNEALPSLRPGRTLLAVYRRDYGLLHLPLTAPAFALFQALAEGETLAEAMEQMLAAGGASPKQVFNWFRHWFSERMFSSVEIG